MAAGKIKLYMRVAPSTGKWAYVPAAYTGKGKIRPEYALIDGKAEHHPEGVYALRFADGARRVWESVGRDGVLALTRLQQMQLRSDAEALGIEVSRTGRIVPEPVATVDSSRSVRNAVAEYLAETHAHKARKTFLAYSRTLKLFLLSCSKRSLEELERADLLEYVTFLKKQGLAPRTVRNRVDYLQIFLHRWGIASLLKGSDLPKFTEKAVRAYDSQHLERLLSVATPEEAEIVQFFVCTGCREREVQFAAYTDIDFVEKRFTVTEKLDLGFRPKDKEEGAIPLPDFLVEMLLQRRRRHSKARLIFPGPAGKSNGHLLRVVKRLALRAGLNCGFCYNKSGDCCSDHPVCRHNILHRFRKTFATLHHRNGMPVRTVMKYLRHSDLDTTLRYLASEEDEQTMAIVNSTFREFALGQ